MRRALGGLALVGSLGGGLASAGPAVDVSGATACSIDVYSLDDDPSGLNVRSGPSPAAPVVATLVNDRAQDGEDFKVEMRVVGSKDGWLLIDRAFFRDYGEPAKAGTVFAAKGWISGKLAGTDVAEVALRAGPSPDARIVATLYSPNASSPVGDVDRLEVSRIFACAGEWAEIEGEFRGETLKGWATRLCSNQVSICR